MYYGEKRVENPIRWGMVGGGRGSQIGYIHRSAALRDFNFELVAGAFDIDPERGKDFGKQLHVDPDRCYPDYKTMFAEEAKRPDGVQAVSIATPNGMHYEVSVSYTHLKTIYPRIALEHGTTVSAVERAIRHAIAAAWNNGGLRGIKGDPCTALLTFRRKPTNKGCITAFADMIRLVYGTAIGL